MRFVPWLFLTACSFNPTTSSGGDDDVPPPDSTTPTDAFALPDPRIIPGGGVGDGPITSGLHVFAIDENTDLPIANATVTIGAITGTTDAAGLFSSTDPSLAGKQSILITADGYRTQLWVGANGQNVTIQLRPTTAAPPQGQVAGDIAGWSTINVSGGHQKRATISYTTRDNDGDGVNGIPSGNTNRCQDGTACTFAVKTRTGPVALFAPIIDVFGQSQTIITYAYKTGFSITSGAQLTGQALAIIPPGDLVSVGTNFGTPPAGLPTVFGFLAIELPDEGNATLTATFQSVPGKMPPLSLFPGSSYRLLGLAVSADETAVSLPIRAKQTTTTINVGTWLAPPASVTATRTQVTFAPTTAPLHTLSIQNDAASFFAAVILDDTATIDIPTSVILPQGGLTAVVQGVGSTIDPTNFGLDADRSTITDLGIKSAAVN